MRLAPCTVLFIIWCLLALVIYFGRPGGFGISDCLAAQDIAFEATVDKNVVALGDSVQLSLTFSGASDAPAPEIQEPEGFSAKYLGPSTMMSIINGRMSSSVSHIYILIPLKAGAFTVGPFYANYRGQAYASQPIHIEVVDQPAGSLSQPGQKQTPAMPPQEGPIEEQLKDRIFIELEVGKRDIYISEIVPVTVRLYVNKLAIKDIEYPAVSADGFSKENFKQPDQYRRPLAGLIYDVIEFKTQAYPLKAGALVLGPAQIKCSLVVRKQAERRKAGSPFGDFFGDEDLFGGFFDRYQAYPLDLKSQEVSVNVKPLPMENKPADFAGAVGRFDMQVEAAPVNVKAGDPITLKMVVSGIGNFVGVSAPVLENTQDFKVYQPQSKMENGQKVFEQVIIPLNENVKYAPIVKFSFFDPQAAVYQTVTRGPTAITVSKPDQPVDTSRPALVEAPFGQAQSPLAVLPEKEEVLGRDIIYIKDNPGALIKKGAPLYQNKRLLWPIIACPLIYLALFFIERRNRRFRTDTRYARMYKAYKKARHGLRRAEGFLKQDKQEEFYSAVFKLLQEYIGDRLHIPSGGITAESAEQYLGPKAAPEDLLAGLKALFDTIDAARFAPASVARGQMPEALRQAREIIEGLEKVRL